MRDRLEWVGSGPHGHQPGMSAFGQEADILGKHWLSLKMGGKQMIFRLVRPLPKEPWNKGKLVGQKRPLRLQEIWAIRIRLELNNQIRDLALFNLALDSKLRACDLVSLKVSDIATGLDVQSRATVVQKKTSQPVQFEITPRTGQSITNWIQHMGLKPSDYLFPSRVQQEAHLSTRQYARIVERWVRAIGLDSSQYGTHSLRRTKASLIYRRTKNLRAVQLLLGHTKLESTIRYLGIEVDDALEIAEQTDI